MGGRGSAGGSSGGAGGGISAAESDLNFDKVGTSFSKLPRRLQESINENLKMSSAMKNDIQNGRRHKMVDTWESGFGSNKVKVITDVKDGKINYTVKKRNKILLSTNSKAQAANKVAAFYRDAMKAK